MNRLGIKLLIFVAELMLSSSSHADTLPTPVEARLRTIAAPRVIHAGRYIYAPSPVTGSAIYSAVYLPPGKPRPTPAREGNFKADSNLPPALRLSPDNYKGSGFAKGHLIPWAHFGDLSDCLATWNISNAGPQHPNMNSGIWGQKIEPATRSLRDETHGVFDCTILIYAYRQTEPRWIGEGHVLVPTHFAKLAIQVDENLEPTATRAWIVPNEFIPTPDPDKYLVSIVELESQTQLELCPWIDEATEDRLENAK